MLESQNTLLDISSETLNCLRTPESPLSRHSLIGFHPVKAAQLKKLIDPKALHRPNQPNRLSQSNISDLIKARNLTRLSHNLCKVLFEKRLNSLYRNTRRLDSKKTHLLGYFHPLKIRHNHNVFLSNNNSQILSLDNIKQTPTKWLYKQIYFAQHKTISQTRHWISKLLFNL